MTPNEITRRLVDMTHGVRGRIVLAAVLGLLAAAVGVARLAVQGVALANLFDGAPFAEVVPSLIAVVALPIARLAFVTLQQLVGHHTAAVMKVRLRAKIYAHLLDLGPGALGAGRTGDILVAAVEAVEQLDVYFGQYLPQLVVSVIAPVAIFALMVWIDPLSAALFITFAALALLAPLPFRSRTSSNSAQRRRAYDELAADFVDAIQGLPTLRAFGQGQRVGARLAERSWALFRATMGVLALNIAEGGAANVCMLVGASITLAWGAVRVQSGDLGLAPLMMLLFLGVEVFRPIRELRQLRHRNLLAMASALTFLDLLDRRPTVTDPSVSAVEPGGPISPSVTLDDVSFTYPRATDGSQREPALGHVNLEVPPGGSLAIVGPSGAGKSTIAALILRLYDPDGGQVRLGGHDLRTLTREQVRAQVAIVSQETYLFHGTVAENLRVARADATDDDLARACQAAGAHDFVTELPSGYDTIVGERGLRLSGGQRQRLAIARALLKNAPVLVLDEATSHVDAGNEATIQEALGAAMRDRTTIVIAHRLSTVSRCDRVAVLDRGRVIEQGTPAALLESGGAFARLVATQATATVAGDQISDADEDFLEAGRAFDPAPLPAWTHDLHPATTPNDAPGPRGTFGEAPETIEAFTRDTDAVATGSRLLALVRPQWVRLGVTLAAGILGAAASVALGVTSGLLAGGAGDRDEIGALVVIVPLAAIAAAGLAWFESWISHDMAYRLLCEMRIALYAKLERLAPAYLLGRRTGDLTSMMTGDIETVESFFAHAIAPAFVAVAVPGFALAVLGVNAWPLAIALLPFLALVAASPALVGRTTDNLGTHLRNQTGVVNAHVTDSVQGLREVVAFSYGTRRLAEIVRQSEGLTALQVQYGRQLGFQAGIIEGTQALGGLAVLAFGGWLASTGDTVRATDLPLLTMLAFTCFGPIAQISQVAKELQGAFASGRRLFRVHDAPIAVNDGAGVTGHPTPDGVAALEFDSVTFAYESGLAPALADVSFRVMPGETVAVVGASGAGKSTIAHLAFRFWDPQRGSIRIAGHDARTHRLDDLRRGMALVSQDIYLFRQTVRDNVRLGHPEATNDAVEAACRAAQAHDFIMALPDGYDTRLEERGGSLSGGQRQRLALARALLIDAPLLILDEATSHLDAANEVAVRDAVRGISGTRAILVIAHRLSTIRQADRIVVLDAGRVVEAGTHGELVARGGAYAQLVRTQVKSSEHAMVASTA
jgi:ATP-binding cassette subfamily B protein